MTFLITGGFGFIGSAVVRRLLTTTDAVVINIDKMTYAASPASLGMHAGEARHVHIQADDAIAVAIEIEGQRQADVAQANNCSFHDGEVRGRGVNLTQSRPAALVIRGN